GPDHEHVRDRRVADPGLGALEDESVRGRARARFHAARIRAVVRLGQAEATDQLAGRELRQVLALLRLGAEGVYRQHHERALHAHHRAVARIDAFDLARDQAVGDIVEPGAAVLGRNGRAEQAEHPHLAEDLRLHGLVPERLEHARRELALAVLARGVADHALVLGELVLEEEGVVPLEGSGLLAHRALCSWVPAHRDGISRAPRAVAEKRFILVPARAACRTRVIPGPGGIEYHTGPRFPARRCS